MKRVIISLFIIIISYEFNYHQKIRHIEIRADYIISLMEEYYKNNGYYPDRIEKIINVELVERKMMYDSNKIPGNGNFIILNDSIDKNEYGDILIVGNWNPPNVIYFPKIKKKEINSTYISSKF